jgi:hypothetical protein
MEPSGPVQACTLAHIRITEYNVKISEHFLFALFYFYCLE